MPPEPESKVLKSQLQRIVSFASASRGLFHLLGPRVPFEIASLCPCGAYSASSDRSLAGRPEGTPLVSTACLNLAQMVQWMLDVAFDAKLHRAAR